MPITSGVRNIGHNDGLQRVVWNSYNAVTCVGSGFSTGGLVSGNINNGPDLVILPGQIKDYSLRCQNSDGIWSPWTTIKIVKDAAPVLPPNVPPTSPQIMGVDMSTAAPLNAQTGANVWFTFMATDADGDDVSYHIDWNNDNVTDTILPGSGYVTSGTPLTTIFSWSVAGSYTLRARTEDENGNLSAWNDHTITIANPVVVTPILPAQVALKANKNLVRSGEQTTVESVVNAAFPMNCTLYGVKGGTANFVHSGAPTTVTYTHSTDYLLATQVVRLLCQPQVPGISPDAAAEIRISVVPRVQEI